MPGGGGRQALELRGRPRGRQGEGQGRFGGGLRQGRAAAVAASAGRGEAVGWNCCDSLLGSVLVANSRAI